MTARHPPSPFKRLLFFVVLPIQVAVGVSAPPTQPTAPQVDARSGSTLSTGLAAAYSYSPESDLERDGKISQVSIQRFDVELNASRTLSPDATALFGVAAKFTDFDLSGTVPLPDQLRAIGLSLGARRKLDDWFGPAWSGTVLLRTEFSSDSSGFSDAEPSFGGGAFVSRQQSPTLSWDLGVFGRSQGDLPVLPVIGVRWNFAPKWLASVGFPRTGVTYEYSPQLSLHAGASFDGGLYHVSAARAPGLGNTWLDYKEVRAGVRLEYRITPRLKLTVGGGAVVDREFDYHDRNFSIDGNSAGYVSAGVEARF